MLLTPGVLAVLAGLIGLADPSVTYSQLGLHTRPGHVDMWTMAESGQDTRGRPPREFLSPPIGQQLPAPLIND